MSEYVTKFKNSFLDPRNINANDILTSLDVCSTVVDDDKCISRVQSDVSCNINDIKPSIIGEDVMNDVEMFRCFTEKNSTTVFDKVNHCCLKGSHKLLKQLLSIPIHNIGVLQQRQQVLKAFSEIDQVALTTTHENDILWLYDDIDQNLKELYEMVFFKFCMFKPLNNYPEAITINNVYKIVCSPVIGVIAPLLYIIVPFLIITFKMKLRIPFSVYVKIMLRTLLSGEFLGGSGGSNYNLFRVISCVFSIIFYFQGILNSAELSKTLYKISKHIVDKVNNIVFFLKTAHAYVTKHWTDEIPKIFFNSVGLKALQEEQDYLNTLTTIPFSIRSNFGKQLHTYLTFDKDIIKSILLKTYMIDALMSVSVFKERTKGCFTEFKDNATPMILLQDSFHPCLELDKVVKNSLNIGSEHKNAILTGPNAGGKSTFVKSLIINVLLSQTIGVSMASTAVITPFYVINSQINIPDCKGYESLFEAEMYRCKHKLDLLKEHKDKHCLFIMDEIFNSTNPVEGMAGAYSIAKKISEYQNCILMFTTHYVYLTKLQKTTDRFINLKMNVEKDNGQITYPYQLSQGVSKQYIALDLLAKNGFDQDIITEALKIKEKLTEFKMKK